MKNLFVIALALVTASIASAVSQNKPVVSDNGFELYKDGQGASHLVLNLDEYDPQDPNASAMLDVLADMGEIETLQDPLIHKVGGCDTKVKAVVSKSEQRLRVYLNCSDSPSYTFATSTGKAGHTTPPMNANPSGRLGSISNSSKKYPGGGCAPYGNMPYAVYIAYGGGGYAIHGTCAEGKLGSVASHGCIRISRANAKTFQDIVRAAINSSGKSSVQIIVK